MLKVQRSPCPASLTGADSAGGRELARARQVFAAATPKTGFPFGAYKGADVRQALRNMFHGKCAYCETFYEPAMPVDVEHYRPKSAYYDKGRLHRPGYWWLAMAWENLLPSCADCNREREQQLVGEAKRETAGKANKFPLAKGSPRAHNEGDHVRETPLLLNPTVDIPAEHLEFRKDGMVFPVMADGAESVRGRATIRVVALRRQALVEARRITARETEAAVANVEDALDDLADLEADDISERRRKERRAILEPRLQRRVQEMEMKAAPATPYSAVAETVIRVSGVRDRLLVARFVSPAPLP